MIALPPVTPVRWKNTHRLIPSRYPPTGILDEVASPDDLDLVFELEGWTNDRLASELGVLHTLPREEWVVGRPMASVIMAAFCHPAPGGGRFNDDTRGAWYAARTLATAHAEALHRRSQELKEIGVEDARLEMRLYLADFTGRFHDLRARSRRFADCLLPGSYAASQALTRALLAASSNGVTYPSVRHPTGECLACFRPTLVANVRPSAHYEYRWNGRDALAIRLLAK